MLVPSYQAICVGVIRILDVHPASPTWIAFAASLSAVTPRLNITRTGEIYSPRDVPMLRGFL